MTSERPMPWKVERQFSNLVEKSPMIVDANGRPVGEVFGSPRYGNRDSIPIARLWVAAPRLLGAYAARLFRDGLDSIETVIQRIAEEFDIDRESVTQAIKEYNTSMELP